MKKLQRGMSLIEILVVITIFAILGIIITRSITLSLQGSKKSEGMIAARENLDYTLSIIERQVRSAKQVACVSESQLNYLDQDSGLSSFICLASGGDQFVASGSATIQDRITSNTVKVTACIFRCEDDDANPATPPKYVDIYLEAVPATLLGIQSSRVTTQSRIYLRNY